MLPLNVNGACALMLIALAILMTGCATNSPPSDATCPALPTMPSVSEPIPSVSYSEIVRSDIDRWLKSLTDM